MKKVILGLLVISFHVGIAQHIAYIETDKILEEMQQFKRANEEIDALVKQWETELDAKFKEVKQLYNDYVNNEVMYSEDVKKQKQGEIFEAERKAKELKEQRFGRDGELLKLQQEKIKPLQDSIFEAATKVAKANNYDYVFEKSPETSWIYTNPEYNITEQVKIELGSNK